MQRISAGGTPGRHCAAIGLLIAGLVLPAPATAGLAVATPLMRLAGCGPAVGMPVARAKPPRPGPSARPVPPAAEEPPAMAMHAYYTCAAPRPRPGGLGWRAVGPVRRA